MTFKQELLEALVKYLEQIAADLRPTASLLTLQLCTEKMSNTEVRLLCKECKLIISVLIQSHMIDRDKQHC